MDIDKNNLSLTDFERMWLFLLLEDFKGRVVSLLVQLFQIRHILKYLEAITGDERYKEVKDRITEKILKMLGEEADIKPGTLRWLWNSWTSDRDIRDILWRFVFSGKSAKGLDISPDAVYELVIRLKEWDQRINAMIEGMGEIQSWITRELESIQPGYRVIWQHPRRATRKLIVAISRILRGYYILGLEAFKEFSEASKIVKHEVIPRKTQPPMGFEIFYNTISGIEKIVEKAYYMFSNRHPEALTHQEVAEISLRHIEHTFFVENTKLWLKYFNMFWDKWTWCNNQRWVTLKRDRMDKCNWCSENLYAFNTGAKWPVSNCKGLDDKNYFLKFMEIPSIVWKDIFIHELIPNIVIEDRVKELSQKEWEEAERFRTYYSSLLTELYTKGENITDLLKKMLVETLKNMGELKNEEDEGEFPLSIFVSEFVTHAELSRIPNPNDFPEEAEIRETRFYTLKTPYWFVDIPRHVPMFAHEIMHVLAEEMKLGRLKIPKTQNFVMSDLDLLKRLFHDVMERIFSDVMEHFEEEELSSVADSIAGHLVADLFGLLIGGPAYLFTLFLILAPELIRLKDRSFDRDGHYIRLAFLSYVMKRLAETRFDVSELERRQFKWEKPAKIEKGYSLQFMFLDIPWAAESGENKEFSFERISDDLANIFLFGRGKDENSKVSITQCVDQDEIEKNMNGLIFTVFGEYDMLVMRPHRSRMPTCELKGMLEGKRESVISFSAYHVIYDVYGGEERWEDFMKEVYKKNNKVAFWAFPMIKLFGRTSGSNDMTNLMDIFKRYEDEGLVKLILRSTAWDELAAFCYLGCGQEVNSKIKILSNLTSELFEKGIAELSITRILKQHFPKHKSPLQKGKFKLKIVSGIEKELIALTYLSFRRRREAERRMPINLQEEKEKVIDQIHKIAEEFPFKSESTIAFSISGLGEHIIYKLNLTWGLEDAVILWSAPSREAVDYCAFLTLVENLLTGLATERIVADSVTTLTFD